MAARSKLIRHLLQSLPILLILSLLFLIPVQAQSERADHPILYFFWKEGCPHCEEMEPYLAKLLGRYPQLEVRAYEVPTPQENLNILFDMAKRFGFEATGTPTSFLGDQYWVGFREEMKPEIEAAVEACIETGCADAGEGIAREGVGVRNEIEAVDSQPASTPGGEGSNTITLPLLGTIQLEKQSLFLSTALIAFVDGFNPCSLWVLSMLMALVLHTGSRKKIVIIGLIFLTVTAFIYALFIAGLFSIFSLVSFVGWIQVVVAVVALFFALVNIKDYFWYKEGLSFTIADEKKPGIYQKLNRVVKSSNSLWGLASATVALAAGVSLVEFSCTAGFPVLWTNLIAAHDVTPLIFVLLLLVYMLIYQLDELVIFFTVVFTLKASKLEEKQGRILKLIGGTLMLTLAIVMLINPNLMNDLGSALIIFAIAFGATLLILFVHRFLLPRMGIHIGSEFSPRKRSRRAARQRS